MVTTLGSVIGVSGVSMVGRFGILSAVLKMVASCKIVFKIGSPDCKLTVVEDKGLVSKKTISEPTWQR